MAKQTLNNNVTFGEQRTKINANFTELYEGKVDKSGTKQLSDENYTTAEKSKLASFTEIFTTALKTAYDGAVSWIATNGTALVAHLARTDNPHGVTKSQVGLSNVPNTDFSTSKQDALVSGTNIKTINGNSLLGSGNLTVSGGGGGGGAVTSVAGKTGDVTLVKADVALSNVDNTADNAKAVLSATKLATARNINGVAFDGTGNITVTDSTKQDALVSATNIKTINGNSILGAGNLTISGGGGGVGSLDDVLAVGSTTSRSATFGAKVTATQFEGEATKWSGITGGGSNLTSNPVFQTFDGGTNVAGYTVLSQVRSLLGVNDGSTINNVVSLSSASGAVNVNSGNNVTIGRNFPSSGPLYFNYGGLSYEVTKYVFQNGLGATKASLESKTIITDNFTVATLPTASTGMRCFVTDANSPTFLATVTGGGSVFCPVFYNGSAWKVG